MESALKKREADPLAEELEEGYFSLEQVELDHIAGAIRVCPAL